MVRAEGEVDFRCVNADCPAKLRESLLHFGRARGDEYRGAGRGGGAAVAGSRPGAQRRGPLLADRRAVDRPGSLCGKVRARAARGD